jgi:eukaryotic-like serine/threonine-protein kinase
MLTRTGAKLLDFGLAKLAGQGDRPAADGLTSAPTETRPLTGEGSIVGTVQYMAPEQVEGKPADARTDLWALGAILYEMLTGKRAFSGNSAASLIGNIMTAEPEPLATSQPLTPPELSRLVRRCLSKSPEDRPDTAHDVGDQLRWLREATGSSVATGVRLQPRAWLLTAVVIGTVAGLLMGASSTAIVMWQLRRSPPAAPIVRATLPVNPAEQFGFRNGDTSTPRATDLTWSPDGATLVFVGRREGVRQLYARRLDSKEAWPLQDTEGAWAPAVSPDGQWVAFWAHDTIRKTPLGGGPAVSLASRAPFPWGLAWGTSGSVYYAEGDSGVIWKIPPGGTPAAVTSRREGDFAHILPFPLPDEDVLLYTVRKGRSRYPDVEVVSQSLATGARKVLLKNAADARYVPTGHLVFMRRGTLWAVPFDPVRLAMLGPEVPVLGEVAPKLLGGGPSDYTDAGQFAIAPTGTLAWVPRPVPPDRQSVLVTIDQQGRVTPLPGPPQEYGQVRVSPDGRQLVAEVGTTGGDQLWSYDLTRSTSGVLVGDGDATFPVWSPDSQRIVFKWLKDGRYALAARRLDGPAVPQVVVSGEFIPASFTPDGRQVVAMREAPTPSERAVVVTIDNGTVSPLPLLQSDIPSLRETGLALSPDGRWLAYETLETGQDQVYVRPYPGPGPPQTVAEFGCCAVWNPMGRELFYLGSPEMMAVALAPGSPPRFGKPRTLFKHPGVTMGGEPMRLFDVAPDGQRFYAAQEVESSSPPPVTHINLVLNWFEDLKAKVKGGR